MKEKLNKYNNSINTLRTYPLTYLTLIDPFTAFEYDLSQTACLLITMKRS